MTNTLTITMNTGEEIEGQAATLVLAALKIELEAAKADGSVLDYGEEPVVEEDTRDNELEWLYEHAPCEVDDTVLEWLYPEPDARLVTVLIRLVIKETNTGDALRVVNKLLDNGLVQDSINEHEHSAGPLSVDSVEAREVDA